MQRNCTTVPKYSPLYGNRVTQGQDQGLINTFKFMAESDFPLFPVVLQLTWKCEIKEKSKEAVMNQCFAVVMDWIQRSNLEFELHIYFYVARG